jgi:myo-inositol-1(or 4)-monophosphatase
LDLAYVAAGRLDGFWEIGLNQWDMAAGVLLIQEAGGLVSDLEGGDRYFENGSIVCANPKLHAGLRVRVGDDIYESSVSSQLATLSVSV